MLDVHPPHGTPHGSRDFFIHLFTITIGLLIALSLEGIVEWHHHRHLVHQAQQGLYAEIKGNANAVQGTLDDLHKQQEALKQSAAALSYFQKNNKFPADGDVNIGFRIHTFEDVSWKTAQSTGALSYMQYEAVKGYSDIYATQDELAVSEQQAARDTVVSLGPLLDNANSTFDPPQTEVATTLDRVHTLEGQLTIVNNFMQELDRSYKQFLASHTE